MASLPPYLSDPALWSDYLFKVGEEYGGSASIFFRLQIQFGVAIRRTFTSQTTTSWWFPEFLQVQEWCDLKSLFLVHEVVSSCQILEHSSESGPLLEQSNRGNFKSEAIIYHDIERSKYRVGLVVWQLGWVDLDLERSTILLGQ